MHFTLTKRKWDGDPAANRDKFIGGSDVGTILGFNEWKSPYTLWAEKTGKITPEDISDKESVWWGVQLEDLVAKRFCMKAGKKVRRSNIEYSCKEFPFLVAHVDRVLIGEYAVLECKTTSSWNKFDYANGEVPPAHYSQCQFYMMLTGYKIAYLATKRDNQFYVNTIKRDNEFIEWMVGKCVEFWNMVQNDTAPDVDGSESTSKALAQIYGEEDEEETADLSEFDDILDARDTIASNIASLKAISTEYDNRIKAKMMTATKGYSERYTVTWKANKNGQRQFRVMKKK